MLKYHGNYDHIYDREFSIVAARNKVHVDADVSSGYSSSVFSLTMKDMVSSCTDTTGYISGKRFTKSSIVAPSKMKPNSKVTGQDLIDLARIVIRNVKK